MSSNKPRKLPESTIMKSIQVYLSGIGARLFRNNTAMSWVGHSQKFTCTQSVLVNRGDVLIRNARPLHSGLCVGSSDLIGWCPIKITSDMVGKTLAVFTAVEVKTLTGVLSSTQKNFIDVVNKSGGIGRVVRSVEDCKNVGLQWIKSDP